MTFEEMAWDFVEVFDDLEPEQINEVLVKNVPFERSSRLANHAVKRKSQPEAKDNRTEIGRRKRDDVRVPDRKVDGDCRRKPRDAGDEEGLPKASRGGSATDAEQSP